MSGGRLVTAVHELQPTGGRYGLATMCIGVGQGIATILERIEMPDFFFFFFFFFGKGGCGYPMSPRAYDVRCLMIREQKKKKKKKKKKQPRIEDQTPASTRPSPRLE